MDHAYFFDRLYPLQDAVLGALTAAETGFYLSGGTAASRGYLQHRFSDDLDISLIRWIEAPDPDSFVADLRRLGEELALLPPPR